MSHWHLSVLRICVEHLAEELIFQVSHPPGELKVFTNVDMYKYVMHLYISRSLAV